MVCDLLSVDLIFVTGVGATWRAAQVERGSTVAVFGLGAVGLAVIINRED